MTVKRKQLSYDPNANLSPAELLANKLPLSSKL